MPIATAVQRGTIVYVYDENGHLVFTTSVGSGPNDGLKNYTNTTVTVQTSIFVYTIDERGRTLFVIPAGK